ncbi:phosphatase PAP2 family protein [Chloroflexota bacterium]|nr:phosphatase PAP2 family protein [Chloroflexota bacterium]
MEIINGFEIVVNQFFQSLGIWLKWPMMAITAIGYEQFFVLLLPAIYWCIDQAIGLRMGMVLLLGTDINTFFKFLFHNPRPYWITDTVVPLSHETSFGLPSGHAQIAASVWGWLAVEVKKRWFTISAIVLILLIGISRLYLGVHFFSDVLLGWLLGGLLVLAFAGLSKPVGNWLGKQSVGMKLFWVLVSTVLLLVPVLLASLNANEWVIQPDWAARAGEVDPFSLKGALTTAGTWFGMLAGYVIQTATKGHFLAAQGGWRRLVRFVVGLVGVLALYLGLGAIFPNNGDLLSFSLRFFRYTLIGLWVAWLGPLVFEKLKLLEYEPKSAEA